ncbi:DUF2284 domain-containing protein [Eubacteriaceae bacterium ES2]|nr:DUF2284 domain-containing protein [Eubacteriaceae bacterium ES2]
MEKLLEQIKKTDVYQIGLTKPSKITYLQEIRDICKGNSCRQYGSTWACPPAVGTIEECKKRCMQFDDMIVFTGRFMLKNSFDYRGMLTSMSDFKQIARELESVVKPYLKKYLVLSNEGCGICKTCTYPDEPCRFPDKIHHAIEGYGILVNDLAKTAGVNYNNGENTVTYFGALLCNSSEIKKL